jgi:hypothetical protein
MMKQFKKRVVANSLEPNVFPSIYKDKSYAKNSFTLESLKNQFRDLARPNRFKVIIHPPAALKEDFDYEFVTLMVKKVNMPSVTIQEYVYERAGKKLHIPTHVEFADLSITFFNDTNHVMRNLIFKWQRLAVSNWGLNRNALPALALQGKIEVHQYDGSNMSTAAIEFTNCWPKTMQNIDFGHEMDNAVSDFTVDFVYTQQNMGMAEDE